MQQQTASTTTLSLSVARRAVGDSEHRHPLKPQPWQREHSSTLALVAMGFHFLCPSPPNYDVRAACMLRNCYKESRPKIDRHVKAASLACLTMQRGHPQHIDSTVYLKLLCYQAASEPCLWTSTETERQLHPRPLFLNEWYRIIMVFNECKPASLPPPRRRNVSAETCCFCTNKSDILRHLKN